MRDIKLVATTRPMKEIPEDENFISVIITTEGQMVEEKVAQGLGYGLEEESLRVIKTIEGEWVPGKVKGNPVNTRLLIPVRFGLM